jgi:hypothetical protein
MIATASATTATKKGNKNILCCVTKVLVAAQEVLVYWSLELNIQQTGTRFLNQIKLNQKPAVYSIISKTWLIKLLE